MQVKALPPLAKRWPDVPVEVLAARTLSLTTLGPRRRAVRRARSDAELEALAGHRRSRCVRSCRRGTGAGDALAHGKVRAGDCRGGGLRRPGAGRKGAAPSGGQAPRPEVRDAQLEADVSGTFGVAAAARAAAPAVR
jgi:hypothetical protein